MYITKFSKIIFIVLFNFFIAAMYSGKTHSSPAKPASLTQTKELIELGKFMKAEASIILQLKKKPRDAQWRYLNALLKAEKGVKSNSKTLINDAISLFELLTEEFPELPEPHNNLGVLYNRLNQNLRSIKSFKMAVVNNPNYTLAHENLADLYLFLAIEAYKEGVKRSSNERLRAKSKYLENVPFFSLRNLDLRILTKKQEE